MTENQIKVLDYLAENTIKDKHDFFKTIYI